MSFNTDFIGTGTMKKFVAECVKAFSAMNDIKIIMPPNYSGAEPELKIENDDENTKLVFDMAEALVFTLNNVQWNLSGSASFDSYSVEVVGGQLIINVSASSVCP